MSAFNKDSGVTDVVIPATYHGQKVVGIKESSSGTKGVFATTTITSVILSEGIEYIGDRTFYNCSNLSEVTLFGGLTNIGVEAFYNCEVLKEISIPNSVTSVGYSSFYGVFYGCSNLNYNIYNNAKYLGNSDNPYLVLIEATSTSITSCEINENCKIVEECAFYNCGDLKAITIPENLSSIGGYAFRNCSVLSSVNFLGTITQWTQINFYGSSDSNPLQYARKLLIQGEEINSINLSGISSIKQYAFVNCGNITSVIISGSVTSIGSYAFSSCSSLTTITIPESITSIGDSAFSGCSSLTTITIPESVTSIGRYAFDGCSKLTSVTFENTSGWKAGTTSVVVNIPSQNATYLTNTYRSSDWKRS